MGVKAVATPTLITLGPLNTVSTVSNQSIAIGTLNTVSGGGPIAIGNNITATGSGSITFGSFATDRGRFNGVFHASGRSAINGDHLAGIDIMLRQRTTDATPTRATANAGAPGATNSLSLIDNMSLAFSGNVVASVGGTSAKGWTINGLIRRAAGVGTTVLVGSAVTVTYADAALTSATIALAADTTLGCLSATVTGVAATNIGWTFSIQTAEVV